MKTHKQNNLREEVREALRSAPALQKDDARLIIAIWSTHALRMGKDTSEISGAELLEMFADKLLPNIKTISRERRIAQRQNPYLYGEYPRRKEKEVWMRDKMRNEI